jgi:carbonic anhydrase/acetyltransferase-like protein (isoleucine patch superfamily)
MAIYALGEQVPDIHPEAYVHPDAVIIGSVTIGAESSVWPTAVIRGDDGHIVIGARTSIQDGTIIHTTPFTPTTVGDDCVIGHNVHLEGCTIEDGALVGSGSVVLHNAIVRTEALVGANALVPGGTEVPSRAMALGVPCVIKEDRVDPDAMIKLGAKAYVDRIPRYRDALRRIG